MKKEEKLNKGVLPDTPDKEAGRFYCRTCKRHHSGKLDGPGYGHWPFQETSQLKVPMKDNKGSFVRDQNDKVVFEYQIVRSKAAIMYDRLLEQSKKAIFIPLDNGETPVKGRTPLAFCNLNGLRIGMYKNTYVDVPDQIADVMRDSLNQTARIPFDAKTAPNPYTGVENIANLAVRAGDPGAQQALEI